jgi:hypothetical protein
MVSSKVGSCPYPQLYDIQNNLSGKNTPAYLEIALAKNQSFLSSTPERFFVKSERVHTWNILLRTLVIGEQTVAVYVCYSCQNNNHC